MSKKIKGILIMILGYSSVIGLTWFAFGVKTVIALALMSLFIVGFWTIACGLDKFLDK